jgi:hypothetical protein
MCYKALGTRAVAWSHLLESSWDVQNGLVRATPHGKGNQYVVWGRLPDDIESLNPGGVTRTSLLCTSQLHPQGDYTNCSYTQCPIKTCCVCLLTSLQKALHPPKCKAASWVHQRLSVATFWVCSRGLQNGLVRALLHGKGDLNVVWGGLPDGTPITLPMKSTCTSLLCTSQLHHPRGLHTCPGLNG